MTVVGKPAIARFQGGPWADQLREVQYCTQTMHPGGPGADAMYLLDPESDPPVYYWRGEGLGDQDADG